MHPPVNLCGISKYLKQVTTRCIHGYDYPGGRGRFAAVLSEQTIHSLESMVTLLSIEDACDRSSNDGGGGGDATWFSLREGVLVQLESRSKYFTPRPDVYLLLDHL